MAGIIAANLSMRVVSAFIALLIFGVSGTITGLVSRLLYFNSFNGQTVKVYFLEGQFQNRINQTFESPLWSNDMAHRDPKAVHLGSTYTLLIAGVFCAVLSIVVLMQTLRERQHIYCFTLSGRRVHSIEIAGPRAVLVLDSCQTVIAVIAVSVSWAKHASSAHNLDWNVFPAYHVNYPLYTYFEYRGHGAPPAFTLENWHCMLYSRTYEHSGPPHVSYGEIKRLCYEGVSARMAVVPLLVLALLRLMLIPINYFIVWRRRNIESREAQGEAGKDADMVSLTARSEGETSRITINVLEYRAPVKEVNSDAVKEVDGGQELSVVELPGDRTSKLEMSDDGALQEMQAEHLCKEMGSDVAAYEMNGGQGKN